jgi:L-lactate dehydrogenase complex protein LldG
MSQTAKQDILDRLKAAPIGDLPARPTVPGLNELAWNQEEMIERFVENLIALGCAVHRVGDSREAQEKLAEITKAEGLEKIVVSSDDVVAALELPEWGERHNVRVFTAKDCGDLEDFKRVVFEEAEAGVTGVDFAVAESGTLCLIHDENQPRLVSLAPIRHIAIVPEDRITPVYEAVTDRLFGKGRPAPDHLTFISGPSMTADIQATLFTGMHGPKTVTVILVEQKSD